MEKTRLEAFSDGVFAIAITLLVLELAVPRDAPDLAKALGDRWPSFAAYVVSFAVIGIMWVNHHAILHNVARVDRPLLFINLLLLMFIAVVPFPTALLAEYLVEGGWNSKVAAAIYSGNLFGCAIAFQLLWRWIVHDARLLHEEIERGKRAEIRFAIGLLVYASTVGLSLVNAKLTLLVHALIAIYYVFDQLPLGARAPR